MDFLEQMNSLQFKQIEKFFGTMLKLSHTVEIVNPKTKVENLSLYWKDCQVFFILSHDPHGS